MTDDELIRKCQAGDRESFEELLGRYYETIYRFAFKWCQDQANAQDITQVACMKLAKSIKQFNFDSSFSSWLYVLVINCAKDFYKSPSQRNTREEQHDDLEARAGSIADTGSKLLYARQILEHISTMQEDLRETLVLVYGSGLSHLQAAERLNVKESTVSWRVHEARKLLKQTFSSSGLEVSDSAESAGGLV